MLQIVNCKPPESELVGWPSGLRRWFKAPVTSVAWVRIPPLPLFCFFFLLRRFDACDAPSVAVMCFKLSLKHNPYLWTSFKALCELGMKKFNLLKETNSSESSLSFLFAGERIDPQECFNGSNCPIFSGQSKQQWTSCVPTGQLPGKVILCHVLLKKLL